jgi:hypothetical protein
LCTRRTGRGTTPTLPHSLQPSHGCLSFSCALHLPMCNELIGQAACLACGGHPHIFRWIFELGLGPPPHQNVQATHSSQGSQAGTQPPKQAGQGLGQPRKHATREPQEPCPPPPHAHSTHTQHPHRQALPQLLPASLPCHVQPRRAPCHPWLGLETPLGHLWQGWV